MKSVLIFNLTTLLLLNVLDYIFNARPTYFILVFMANLIPIVGAFLAGSLIILLFKSFWKSILLLTVILFFLNELAFGLFEQRFILFGLIQPTDFNEFRPTTSIHYVFISVVGLVGILITNTIYKLTKHT
jgi:hypothetical protein